MFTKRILAFDFGASSGRAMLASFTDGKISMEEIHRFSNDPVKIGDRLYWDILRLFFEIKQGITIATQKGGFDSIGIDTWGVDFGLLDTNGELISNPSHYRDNRTDDIPDQLLQTITKLELYSKTGVQFLTFNTIYQLYYLKKYRPEVLEPAKSLLLIPDLFAYFLTGKKRMEYSNASTTNLLNPIKKCIDNEILNILGIDSSLIPPMIYPGDSYGNLSEEICKELHCKSVPVFAVATHDTASAVAAIPTLEQDYAYISCGTWSLLGTVIDQPLLTSESAKIGFTNEIASDRKIRYLKNIMGLWIIQQTRYEWRRKGEAISFDEIERQACNAEPFRCFIDPDDAIFSPPGDMTCRIMEYCRRTNQYIPKETGEILRCIYDSLAMKYKYQLESMSKITKKTYNKLHMIGGGIKDKLLCSMTASACNIPVISGPIEATSTGNILVQLIALGAVPNLDEARRIVISDVPVKIYEPQDPDVFTANYERFKKIIK